MVSTFDVAIVGGGPAGTSVALHLVREHGLSPGRVVLFDKARFPRDKPCAGAVSAWGLDALRSLGVPLTVPALPMTGLRVQGAEGGAEQAAPELGVVVRRSAFDASLVDRVRADGVVVRDGEGVEGCIQSGDTVRLRTATGEIGARFVLACDGTGSTVRKLLGVREACRKGHLYVLDTPPGKGDAAVARGLCVFDLACEADGIEGYVWDFPTPLEGVTAISRGIYHANFSPTSRLKAALARALRARGVDPDGVAMRPYSTRPFVRGTELGVGRVLFVGEAAGIDATTGEGIAQAILMGGYAAKAVAVGLRRGADARAAYAASLKGSLLVRRLLQSAWLAPRVYGPRGRAFRSLLVASPYAVGAGARWYEGRRLPLATKARLGAELAWSFVAPRA